VDHERVDERDEQRERDREARGGAEIVTGKDPCVLPKARKNPAEQEGARAAQKRDGVAMARFLCWLDPNDFAISLNS